jgi:hypothetical protein
MKKLLLTIILLLSTNVIAGGRMTWAVPTQVDLERGNGIMVYGDFGNPNGCTVPNRFYVPKTHPEYDKIYGLIMTAFSAKQEMRAYTHSCKSIGWYSVPSTTYNFIDTGDISIRH